MVQSIDRDLDLVFGALADSNRRKMILSLMSGDQTVEALGQPLGMSTAGALKHVRILEESGLIESEKRGRSRFCHLRVERLETVTGWIHDVQRFWTGNLERLVKYLQENHD
ncbi:MAG TPA: metalloregulator ArsR/SmtB family transcription factor [Fimbriimonas sp.]|nr:metalloregulator ArsR/SmtB family transcription factor [Fimbriimonas sp.]